MTPFLSKAHVFNLADQLALGHPAQERQKLLEKRAVYGIRIGVVHDL